MAPSILTDITVIAILSKDLVSLLVLATVRIDTEPTSEHFLVTTVAVCVPLVPTHSCAQKAYHTS